MWAPEQGEREVKSSSVAPPKRSWKIPDLSPALIYLDDSRSSLLNKEEREKTNSQLLEPLITIYTTSLSLFLLAPLFVLQVYRALGNPLSSSIPSIPLLQIASTTQN